MERAEARGVESPPPEILDQWAPLVLTFVVLLNEAARKVGAEFGVTSWYRDAGINLVVGGKPESQHLLGLAADITGSPEARKALLTAARGLGLVPSQDRNHLHVQLLPAGALAAAGVVFPRPVVA